MNIRYRQIAFARTGSHPLEHEFVTAGNFQEGQILRRRAHENQIVILRIVQREEATALNAKIAVQRAEHLIEVMHREHFADARVVIPDGVGGIARGIVITNPRLRALV